MKKIILLIILGFIAIALLGLTISLQQNTLIEWWKPLAVAVIPATILGLSFAEISSRISGWSNRTLNIIASATFWLIAALGCFYALNFFGSDTDSTIDCHARVINKYTEEHYRPRRISRYTSVRGQKYRVYYINLLTSSTCHPKIIREKRGDALMALHEHCLADCGLVLWQCQLYCYDCLGKREHFVHAHVYC